MKKQNLNFIIASCILVLFTQNLFSADFTIQGFATLNGGTTGGEGGTTVTVSSADDFISYCSASGTYIIYVSGTIYLDGMISVASNKSILGVDGTSGVISGGGLSMSGASNIIIQNMTFTGSPDDAINIQDYSTNIWIDHCDFSDAYDGLCDIRLGSNYITVSWCKFSNHDKVGLIGSSDNNASINSGRLKVTYHHNWFEGTNQRHPLCRFGEIHVYNNYYNDISFYGISSNSDAMVYVERNYFNSCAYSTLVDGGYLTLYNNYFVDSGDPEYTGSTFTPSDYYSYSVEAAANVPSSVTANAGVGVVSTSSSSSSSGVTNSTISGTYSILAYHSGMALDCYAWGTSNGTNICQWEYWGGNCQKFIITPVDDEWHRITPYIATDQAMDVYGISTESGANINTWEYWGGYGQQFRFQVAGSGRWRIINRNSEKCLDVEGASTDNGANVLQWTCTANSTWQMFTLTKHSSSREGVSDVSETFADGVSVYPNPASETVNVNLPGSLKTATVTVFDQAGRMVLTTEISTSNSTVNISTLESGMYIIKVNSDSMNFTSKFLVE